MPTAHPTPPAPCTRKRYLTFDAAFNRALRARLATGIQPRHLTEWCPQCGGQFHVARELEEHVR
jgi:hypothetical protein